MTGLGGQFGVRRAVRSIGRGADPDLRQAWDQYEFTRDGAQVVMAGLDQLYVAAHDTHRWVPVERRNILAGVAGQVRGLQ